MLRPNHIDASIEAPMSYITNCSSFAHLHTGHVDGSTSAAITTAQGQS